MNRARVIVLAIAAFAGLAAAYIASQMSEPRVVEVPTTAPRVETVPILTAAKDIETGQRLAPGDVTWSDWPAGSVSAAFIRRSGANQVEQLVGSIARTPIAAGEPVREAKLIRANGSGYLAAMLPPGMKAISTEITPESGAAGFILPNDRVDVILTSAQKQGGQETYKSRTILTGVKVLAIDQNIEEKNGQKVVIGKIATLELDSRAAEALALARRLGSLSLILRSLADRVSSTENDLDAMVSAEPITIVRHGVRSVQ